MRYTIKQLNNLSAIDFAISVLIERKSTITNVYAPLNQKINKTIKELEKIKAEQQQKG